MHCMYQWSSTECLGGFQPSDVATPGQATDTMPASTCSLRHLLAPWCDGFFVTVAWSWSHQQSLYLSFPWPQLALSVAMVASVPYMQLGPLLSD